MTIAAADIDFLRQIVADCSGHVISAQQGYLFESRLQPVLDSEGFPSVGELVKELRANRKQIVFDRVAEAMTINETFFFRDMHPFDALRTQIVPELLEKRKATRRLNIWCAACSTGQEPYSVAITLREHFPELADWNIKILASDLCDEVLDKARSGTFTQFEVNRGLPAKMLVRYFDKVGANWQVKPEIKSMLEFRKLNLSRMWPSVATCDVVFLRNVLIYFSQQMKQSILTRLRETMATDGFLILGGGETLINLKSPFQRQDISGTVYYRPQQ